MIKHIVMWKFKDSAEGRSKEENLEIFRDMIANLGNHIEQIKHAETGIDFNRSAAAFDVVLYSEFASREDLGIYQDHPEHVKVKEFLGKVSLDRAVVDYEM
jgi:hypothetical protein